MSDVRVHRGPWESITPANAKCPALRFVEKYIRAVDSNERASLSWRSFYAPVAVYHDTKGGAMIGGQNIWERINRLLTPFQTIHNEPTEIRIVPCDVDPGHCIVYGQFVTHFLLKGDLDEEEILVPKFAVWTLGRVEDGSEEVGEEGLVILDSKQYYDNAVIGRYVTEKLKRESRKRRFEEPDDEIHQGSRSVGRKA